MGIKSKKNSLGLELGNSRKRSSEVRDERKRECLGNQWILEQDLSLSHPTNGVAYAQDNFREKNHLRGVKFMHLSPGTFCLLKFCLNSRARENFILKTFFSP